METTAEINESSLLFGMAGRILYTYPTEEFYKEIIDGGLFSEIPFPCKNDSYKKGAELLKGWQEKEIENKCGSMVTDYQNLFVGVSDIVKAPLWESIYVSSDPILFQDSTLKARRWYAEYGLEAENIRKEPEDSAGQELMFLAFLLSSGLEGKAAEFFNERLRSWIGKFCDAVSANAETDFFKGLALLIKGATETFGNYHKI